VGGFFGVWVFFFCLCVFLWFFGGGVFVLVFFFFFFLSFFFFCVFFFWFCVLFFFSFFIFFCILVQFFLISPGTGKDLRETKGEDVIVGRCTGPARTRINSLPATRHPPRRKEKDPPRMNVTQRTIPLLHNKFVVVLSLSESHPLRRIGVVRLFSVEFLDNVHPPFPGGTWNPAKDISQDSDIALCTVQRALFLPNSEIVF